MKAWIPALLWLGFAGLNVHAQSNSAPARLALICTDPAVTGMADLLTADLSRVNGLALLERGQIEKIYREQGLSAANGDFIKLGQVLGADGLLMLGLTPEGTNQLLTARLVAVRPGVVIDSFRAPWPLGKPADWQHLLMARILPLLPKLTVLARDAVPVSVLNLRSGARGGPDESAERELTLLLIHRLVRERGIFVLEREHLAELASEKELKPEDESAFWTGRYLLDGVLDRDAFDPNLLTINARLVSATGAAPVTIDLTGPRTNLAAVVELLTAKVLTALHQQPAAADWRPLEEAQQFAEEAQWAFRWGLRAEASAASESAWALGKHTDGLATLRLRSYAAAVQPFDGTWSTDKPTIPDPATLVPAIRALDLFSEDTPLFAVTNGRPNTLWIQAGFDTIRLATGLLQNYHTVAETREAAGEDLPRLRAAARRAAAVMPGHTVLINLAPTNTLIASNMWNYQVRSWHDLQWQSGGMWYEKPEDALPMLEQLAASGCSCPGYPNLFAWSWADRIRVPSVHKQFLADLRGLTNEFLRVIVCCLTASDDVPAPNGHLEEREQEWADEIWNQRQKLYEGRMIAEIGWNPLVAFDGLMRAKFKIPPDNPPSPVTNDPFAGFMLKLRTDYLTNVRTLNGEGFSELFPYTPGYRYSPEAARKLGPLLQQFAKRVGREDDPTFRGLLKAWEETVARGKPVIKSAPDMPVSTALAVEPPAALSMTEISLVRPDGAPFEKAAVMSSCFRLGRLWFLATQPAAFHMDFKPGPKAAIVSVDLETGGYDTIWVPEELAEPSPSFEVTAETLYASAGDKILRYAFKDKQWQVTTAPVQNPYFYLLDGRIYLTMPGSLLEFHPETRATDILASARHRPAQNRWEELGAAGNGSSLPFPATAGRLGLVSANHFFTYEPTQKDWGETALPVFVGSPKTFPVTADNRILLEVNGNLTRARVLEFDRSTGAFGELLEHRFPYDTRDPRADRVLGPPRYRWPKTVGLHGAFTTTDGAALWSLSPHQWWEQNIDPAEATLLRFEPPFRDPLPMLFRFNWRDQGTRIAGQSPGRQGAKYLNFFATPAGLVVQYLAEPLGYWLIPQKTLDGKLEPLRRAARARAETEDKWNQAVLARFDANKNGVLDPDELAAMHLDPACLEHDRADIDQDGNGFLDVDEFPYFDANRNGVIEERERAAIHVFNVLLAGKALEKFDANHDGKLQPDEWRGFIQAGEDALRYQKTLKTPEAVAALTGQLGAFDKNGDGALDLMEIANFLDRRFEAIDLAAYEITMAPQPVKPEQR